MTLEQLSQWHAKGYQIEIDGDQGLLIISRMRRYSGKEVRDRWTARIGK